MNRNQRRYGRSPKRNDSDPKMRSRNRNTTELVEVMPPRSRHECRPRFDRSCYVAPDQKSFGQITEHTDELYQNLLDEIEFEDFPADTLAEVRALKKAFYANRHKVEIGSQCANPDEACTKGQLHSDNDRGKGHKVMELRHEETLTKYHNLPQNIVISDSPRVKVITGKYTKYKQGNIELRKLEERVVCVEYDIYDNGALVQVMRAFFCYKPDGDSENTLKELPSTIKTNFKISSQDLQKLNQHEVEIIDGKILENQPYLEDLRKILARKPTVEKPNHSLDAKTLYEIANREYLDINTTNLNHLTQEELSDVQKLILENSRSSAHGINRRTLKINRSKKDISHTSQTILAELMKKY